MLEFLAIAGIVLIVIFSVLFGRGLKEDMGLAQWVLMILIIIFAWVGSYFSLEAGYKRGQIDSINGEIIYELTNQDDGSSSWEKIK